MEPLNNSTFAIFPSASEAFTETTIVSPSAIEALEAGLTIETTGKRLTLSPTVNDTSEEVADAPLSLYAFAVMA